MAKASRLPSMVMGTLLSGGGMAHLWRHSVWGTLDVGVITIITLGIGIMFNPEVVALIRAYRAGRSYTEEQKKP